MAHRLLSGKSLKCATPHGHNEYIRVSLTVPGFDKLNHQDNMVTNFADAKSHWHSFIDEHLDHCFQLSHEDPLIDYFKKNEPHQLARLLISPGDPTTEILAACLMSKLDCILKSIKSPLVCESLDLEETPTNTVFLQGEGAYKAHLPEGDFWWNRSDNSINNF